MSVARSETMFKHFLLCLLFAIVSSGLGAKEQPPFKVSDLEVGASIKSKEILLEKGYKLIKSLDGVWHYSRIRSISDYNLNEEIIVFADKGDKSRIAEVVYAWKPDGMSYISDEEKIPANISYNQSYKRLKNKYGPAISYDDVFDVFYTINKDKISTMLAEYKVKCDKMSSSERPADCKSVSNLNDIKMGLNTVFNEIPYLSCEQVEQFENVLNQDFCLLHMFGGDTKNIERGHSNQALFSGFDSIWQSNDEILMLGYRNGRSIGLSDTSFENDYYLSLYITETLPLKRNYGAKSKELDF